jgi:hypothetical protein
MLIEKMPECVHLAGRKTGFITNITLFDQYSANSRKLVFADKKIQIAEHAESDVSVHRGSENWTLETDRRDSGRFEQRQEPQEFLRLNSGAAGRGANLVSEVIQNAYRDCFRGDRIKSGVDKRRDSMLPRDPLQLSPVDGFAEQDSNGLRRARLDASSRTKQ